MLEFYLIFLLFLTFSVVEFYYYDWLKQRKKIYIGLYILLTFLLILHAGLRGIGIDRDSIMYQEYFMYFSKKSYYDLLFNNDHRVKEIGYLLLNKFFSNKFLNFRFLLFFVSSITIGIKSFAFYKYTDRPVFAAFIYLATFFYLREYTQIRDAMAVSFMILTTIFFFKKKYLISFVYFLLATSFHNLALCVYPILLMVKYIKENQYYYIGIIIAMLFFYFIDYDYILNNNWIPYQLSKYNMVSGRGSFSILMLGVLGVLFYKIESLKNDIFLNDCYRLVLLGIMIGFLLFNHPVLLRITSFLMFFSIILMTNFSKFKNDYFYYKEIKFYFIVLVMIGFYVKNFIFSNLVIIK